VVVLKIKMNTKFKLNGQIIELDCDPAERLSHILRDELWMTGTKVGCNTGDCGACSVIMNGNLCCACLIPAGQISESEITTVEGLASYEILSDLQQSFLDHGATQCGICTPAMLISAHWLLDKNAKPSRHEVEEAIGGVLCRCTGYSKIVDSIIYHSRQLRASMSTSRHKGNSVGTSRPRLDGLSKVTGKDHFGADHFPKDSLLARLVRSPHNHAKFKIGNIEVFKTNNPGVSTVLTARDIPGENCHGVIPEFADQPILAVDKTRYPGEAVAIIVGEPNTVRKLDLDTFPIEWEPLSCVLTIEEAQAEGAPLLHESRIHNILTKGHVARGSVRNGFKNSEHIVENHYSTPFIEHAYIEPEAGYAVRIAQRLELYGCTQAPYMNRDSLARILGIDPTSIRIIPSSCGGGFGSKLDISYQPYIALAAWKLNQPVRIIYSRRESMQSTTKRHPSEIHVKIGCKTSGELTAIEFNGTFNTGAYASWGPTVANRVPVHASGPYKVPNYLAKSLAVHTNAPTAGAFRGFGVPQAAIALETSLSELACKANLDELEFRLLNCLQNGDNTVTGQIFEMGVGIKECLESVKNPWKVALRKSGYYNSNNAHFPNKKGVGLAACWYGCGNTSMPNPSTIRVGLTAKGRIVLHQGATDIGQGSTTVIAQILSDSLGTPLECIDLIGADTDLTPDAGKTSASRQTFISGAAAALAGLALRKKILRYANAGDNAQLLVTKNGLHIKDGINLHALDISHLPTNEFGYTIMAEETYDPPTSSLDSNGQGKPYAVYGYGVHMVELTVDTKLGSIKIDRITAAHDVGRAINPNLIEGQIEGGISQGIGLALMEDYKPYRSENLHDYLIPTSGDIPEIKTIIVEEPDWISPHGGKGLGEHVLIPTAPAILNGIRNATGAKVTNLPATPDKVLHAIQTKSVEYG